MLAGGLLAAAGMVLASFARRLLELYLTAGVLTGEGGAPPGGDGAPALRVPLLASRGGVGGARGAWPAPHPPAGLGLALNFQPSLVMLGLYFDRRRPLANGLAAARSPVFLAALSPLGQQLQERFGWRGGFLLHCCACGALMRPPGPALGAGAARAPGMRGPRPRPPAGG